MRVFSLLSLVIVLASCHQEPGIEHGSIEIIESFDFSEIPDRQVEIYLPPEYNESKTYPVIYMHDGQNVFNASTSSFGTSWEVDEKLDSLISLGYLNPVIVVAVWNNPLRWNEYLPEICKVSGIDSSRAFPYLRTSILDTAVYSDTYMKSLALELKPYVDENYATDPSSTNTFLMGSSMGGLISFYGTMLYPTVFGGAACLSTHWSALDGACITAFQAQLPSLTDGRRYYFDYGRLGLDSAYNDLQVRMDRSLNKAGYERGVQWETMAYPEGDHNEASWQKRVHVPLQFLVGKPE